MAAPTEGPDDFVAAYEEVAGRATIQQLRRLAAPLRGARVVHVSTRRGDKVAEILRKLVPFKQALGIDARWEEIGGDALFEQSGAGFRRALQGEHAQPPSEQLAAYERTNTERADQLRPLLEEADYVFVHDAQPAALLDCCPSRRGKWIWRCHTDAGRPYEPVWTYLKKWLAAYDAAVFSLPEFAPPLPCPQYVIPPSIDPLSEKNCALPAEEVAAARARFGLDGGLPTVLQVSRFDRFKDPLGVIEAYRLVRKLTPLQLVLAGGDPGDDAEGAAVLEEVLLAAAGDPHIHVLPLPADAHRLVNALQRAADVVVQKSLREGFGLAVTEALWKGRPVVGGDTGGIRQQVVNNYTGFLVSTPEGAALRLRYLLHRRDLLKEMGERGHRLVRENFLLTRQLREYLTMMVGLRHGRAERIEIGEGTNGNGSEGE